MKLSPTEFDARFESGELRLSFIGMSNIGKSYTAMRLRKSHGFALVEIDEAIQHALDLKSMQESADWMGFPDEDTYSAREAEYLARESLFTASAFDGADSNMILDTTGSVIYTSPDCQNALREQSVIVHIQAAPENLERLEKLFSLAPKPLIWTGHYHPRDGESTNQSLKRCYPELLKARLEAYNDLADINIPASLLFKDTTTPDTLMDFIRNGG